MDNAGIRLSLVLALALWPRLPLPSPFSFERARWPPLDAPAPHSVPVSDLPWVEPPDPECPQFSLPFGKTRVAFWLRSVLANDDAGSKIPLRPPPPQCGTRKTEIEVFWQPWTGGRQPSFFAVCVSQSTAGGQGPQHNLARQPRRTFDPRAAAVSARARTVVGLCWSDCQILMKRPPPSLTGHSQSPGNLRATSQDTELARANVPSQMWRTDRWLAGRGKEPPFRLRHQNL